VAHEALEGMQAQREAQRARALMNELAAALSARTETTLTARGLSNQEIAERLVVSQHTVHRHVANILQKHVSSRSAAAPWGVRAGLI
jgi:DNA-binding NarL/FixJ family response regulator